MTKSFVTRFAPSPSGLLHLGHAYSALMAHQAAVNNGGQFLLRIEDIDLERCKPEFEAAIFEDLAWLGLKWETPVRRQSGHFDDYRQAIQTLQDKNILYPCFCSRKEIRKEIKNSTNAPHGPEGPLYPGTCRNFTPPEQKRKIESGLQFALRLNTAKAMALVKSSMTFMEKGINTPADMTSLGDVVIARKDVMTSYHLSVVVDDHLQGITHVVRGQDLYHATHIHRLLQEILGYHAPQYHHHDLLVGADGKRFAKRDKSMTLKSLREDGHAHSDILELIQKHGGQFPNELQF